VACLQQQLGHGQTHSAGADPAYARRVCCHCLSPFLAMPVELEPAVAAPVNVASTHPLGLERPVGPRLGANPGRVADAGEFLALGVVNQRPLDAADQSRALKYKPGIEL